MRSSPGCPPIRRSTDGRKLAARRHPPTPVVIRPACQDAESYDPSMAHGHVHGHARDGERRALTFALAVIVAFIAIEVAAGVITETESEPQLAT